MTSHWGSIAAGWGCLIAAVGLIFQHVLTGPKVKKWPNDPQALRIIVFALILAMVNRGQNILFHVDDPQGDIPYEGVVVAMLLALYFVGMAYATWRRKHSELTQDALNRMQRLADQKGTVPVHEIVTRGTLSALKARGANVIAPGKSQPGFQDPDKTPLA